MTTIGTNPDCPATIHMLADHLDAALAVGEDLLALELPPRADLDEADPETAPEVIDQFVRRLRELEASLLMRVLQARRRAAEIGRGDASLRAALNLFRAQTALLVELIETADRPNPRGLGAGNIRGLGAGIDGLAYLRSRGLLAPEAAAPSPYESLIVTEELRIGGVAGLGAMLDLVSSLLDLLDASFGLYSVLPDDVLAEVAADLTAVEAETDAEIAPGHSDHEPEPVGTAAVSMPTVGADAGPDGPLGVSPAPVPEVPSDLPPGSTPETLPSAAESTA